MLPDGQGMVTPQISFAVWMKRLPNGANAREGIFGNSNSQGVEPSFQFVGTSNKNFVEVNTQVYRFFCHL